MTPLQPGPLSPGMVSLLTAGRSVLRVREGNAGAAFHEGDLLTYAGAEGGNVLLDVDMCGVRPFPAAPDRFAYIGERGDDGWITAPPGGWGSNPVPGRMVQVAGVGVGAVGPSESITWHAWDAFRLVEEASPVVSIPGTAGSGGQAAKVLGSTGRPR